MRFHPAELPALVLGALALGGGCASALRPFTREHIEIREYKPLSVPAVTAVAARWQRLEALAAEQAWRTDTADPAHGLLIASRPVKGSAETPESSDLREHVRVRLGLKASEIAVQTEVLEDGEWDLRDFTSGSYEYSRESEIAHRIDP